MNRLMETSIWFGRNPEAMEIVSFLREKLEPLGHAESIHVRVELGTGDVTGYVMYPSPLKDTGP